MGNRGRPLRDGAPSHVMTLRVSAREVELLSTLETRWGLPSRSDVVREALRRCASLGPAHDTAHRLTQLTGQIRAGLRLVDDAVILSKAEVAQAISLLGFSEAQAVLVPPLLALLREHVRVHGWFYPPCDTTPVQALRALADGGSRLPAAFLKQRFPSFWLAGDGPASWSPDDTRFRRVVTSRAGFNRRGELFDVSLRRLRYGFQVERHVVSFFQPAWAYAIYRKVLGSARRPVVWDPSAGFGARMLGFAAAYPAGVYCANEPATVTRGDLESLRGELHLAGETASCGSEFATWPEGSVDFVFTSPPYFKVERYFLEPGQSFLEYPDLGQWTEKFVYPTMANAARCLRKGALAAFNVSQDLEAIFADAAAAAGFQFVTRERLELKHHPFKSASADVHEPVLYFQK